MHTQKVLLKNANCYINGSFKMGDILAVNGKIADFQACCCDFGDTQVIDCEGQYLVPGFIDIHTHGAFGADVNAADEEGFARMADFYASKGTTAFLASVLTDSEENTLRILNTIALYKSRGYGGAALLGAHLEGPFLSCKKKGAMPEQYLKSGEIELFERYYQSGVVKYITVAPEIEGGTALIRYAARKLPVAIGHSAASYETALAAIKSGAKASTHTFNAMEGIDRCEPHILGACLESEIYNEIIADGRHVHPANIRLLYRLKGTHKLIAITDSIEATGLADGNYSLGENRVTLQGEDAFLTGTTVRAGSVLTMDKALKNLCAFLDIPLQSALPMLTENPAQLLGLNKGFLRIGFDADLVLLDSAFNVVKTVVGGKVVYTY